MAWLKRMIFGDDSEMTEQTETIPSLPELPKVMKKISDFSVVGRRYHPYSDFNLNDEIILVPEPDNVYDRNAIAAYHNDNKIGYICRAQTGIVSPYLKNEDKKAFIRSYSEFAFECELMM